MISFSNSNKFTLVLCLLLLVFFTLSLNSMAKDVYLRIGTAGLGGAYYPVGAAIAEVLNKNMPGVIATAEITGGSLENPRLVTSGEVELGMANSDLAYYAYSGKEPYKQEHPIATLFEFGPSFVHILTLDPGIKSIADLKGKRVAIGPAGGSLASVFELYIPYYGFSMDEVKPSYISQSEGVSLLIDGSVDMALAHGVPPVASVLELAPRRPNFNILEFEDNILEKIIKDNPYLAKGVITAGLYSGVPQKDIQVLMIPNLVIVRQDMDDELVYKIVKTVYENLDYLYETHVSLRYIPKDTFPVSPIPVHPGAARYYQEQGFKKK